MLQAHSFFAFINQFRALAVITYCLIDKSCVARSANIASLLLQSDEAFCQDLFSSTSLYWNPLYGVTQPLSVKLKPVHMQGIVGE